VPEPDGSAEDPAATPGDVELRLRRGTERGALDTDQTLSDTDQTLSDADGDASERDQDRSDIDQTLSDRDQATADRDHDRDDPRRGDDGVDAYEQTRSERARVSTERDAVQLDRSRTGHQRDLTADDRDANAAQRDISAAMRDAEAAELERSIAQTDAGLARRFEHLRRQGAADRAEAGRDRARAARDRAEGARARARVEAELMAAHVDDLTGAYRREMGRIALGNEIDRARRGDGRLVVAFVDLDDLKGINDRQGHAAGDDALRTVVSAIRSKLRSFDPVLRYGGDEFVAGMCEVNEADVRLRFEAIRESLVGVGITVSLGMAALEPGDTVDTIIARADAALLKGRRETRGPPQEP
jgi:diguanylate cyclase (GGDEF)-like protein